MTAAGTMRALQFQAIGQLVEVRLPVPCPKPDEVLVQTIAATICTSDLNDLSHNPFGIRLPRVLGHEAAGVVADVGKLVHDLRPGERVTVHPVIPCRSCDNCRRGLGHLCSNLGHLGLDRDGAYAEFFCAPRERVRRVPAGTEMACAALLEPVAVCLEAVERGRINNGETVLVVGDGPFGILIARLALSRDPTRVILVGRHEFRLSQVPEAIRVNAQHQPNVLKAILETNEGVGVDVAILAVGSLCGLEIGLGSLRSRGRLVVFSAIEGAANVDLFRLHTQELEILGACNDENLIDKALEELSNAKLSLDSLVTHRLPFQEWPRAFELARNGKDEALKVALLFGNHA
jgi:2-desacetyl-2-hydroxyethyl bacteriochlorophyllide A dehydrogenase